ncbi:TPA: bifunctional nuclease family protein [Candidatus Poribacteria bacterium]|nr:bifunctional nuclease family protein [Candidatus Poribacteria bacterium]
MIAFDINAQPIVFLREKEGSPKRLLPIWVGIAEAQAIHFKIQNQEFPRPMTHDLLKNIIESLGAKVTSVYIHSIQETTFYGQINLAVNGTELKIDSRPSDAIALAIRTEAAIYVAEEVMKQSGLSEDELKKIEKDHLKNVLEEMDEDTLGKYKV